MRFSNGKTNYFADLRILKTKYFYINYNKLVIWKFTDGHELVIESKSVDPKLNYRLFC
jgi:hypothetical protein